MVRLRSGQTSTKRDKFPNVDIPSKLLKKHIKESFKRKTRSGCAEILEKKMKSTSKVGPCRRLAEYVRDIRRTRARLDRQAKPVSSTSSSGRVLRHRGLVQEASRPVNNDTSLFNQSRSSKEGNSTIAEKSVNTKRSDRIDDPPIIKRKRLLNQTTEVKNSVPKSKEKLLSNEGSLINSSLKKRENKWKQTLLIENKGTKIHRKKLSTESGVGTGSQSINTKSELSARSTCIESSINNEENSQASAGNSLLLDTVSPPNLKSSDCAKNLLSSHLSSSDEISGAALDTVLEKVSKVSFMSESSKATKCINKGKANSKGTGAKLRRNTVKAKKDIGVSPIRKRGRKLKSVASTQTDPVIVVNFKAALGLKKLQLLVEKTRDSDCQGEFCKVLRHCMNQSPLLRQKQIISHPTKSKESVADILSQVTDSVADLTTEDGPCDHSPAVVKELDPQKSASTNLSTCDINFKNCNMTEHYMSERERANEKKSVSLSNQILCWAGATISRDDINSKCFSLDEELSPSSSNCVQMAEADDFSEQEMSPLLQEPMRDLLHQDERKEEGGVENNETLESYLISSGIDVTSALSSSVLSSSSSTLAVPSATSLTPAASRPTKHTDLDTLTASALGYVCSQSFEEIDRCQPWCSNSASPSSSVETILISDDDDSDENQQNDKGTEKIDRGLGKTIDSDYPTLTVISATSKEELYNNGREYNDDSATDVSRSASGKRVVKRRSRKAPACKRKISTDKGSVVLKHKQNLTPPMDQRDFPDNCGRSATDITTAPVTVSQACEKINGPVDLASESSIDEQSIHNLTKYLQTGISVQTLSGTSDNTVKQLDSVRARLLDYCNSISGSDMLDKESKGIGVTSRSKNPDSSVVSLPTKKSSAIHSSVDIWNECIAENTLEAEFID